MATRKKATSQPPKRPRVRRNNPQDAQRMREELIEAALRLFAQGGVDAVSMRAVAAQVGVSAMAPYRYFTDKGELLGSLWQDILRELYDHVQKALEGEVGGRRREYVADEAIAVYWETHPDEFRLVHQTQGTVQTPDNMAPVYRDLMQLGRELTLGIAAEIGVEPTHAQLADQVRMTMGLGYLGALSNRRYPWQDLPAFRKAYSALMVAAVERSLLNGPEAAPTAKAGRRPTHAVASPSPGAARRSRAAK